MSTETVRGNSVGESLYETLRCRVETMRQGEQLPTEQELAEQQGVSYSTVRRVTARLQEEGVVEKVQGKGTFVSPRGGEKGDQRTGIVYADPWEVHGNPFFTRCLQGVLDESQRREYRLEVLRCPHLSHGGEEFSRLCEDVGRDDVRGLLLPWASRDLVQELRRVSPQIRMVSMSTRYPPEGVASVVLDFAALGRRTAQYMASRGVGKLVAVTAQPESLLGLRSSKPVGGGKLDVMAIDARPGTDQDVEALAERILQADPDGLSFDDDRLAEACLEHLIDREPGLMEKRHVITHANEGENLFPAEVARLVMDSYEIGAGAIKLLHRMIEEERSLGLTLLVHPRLQESRPESKE